MIDQNPPPDTSESTAPEMTMRLRVIVGIVAGGAYALVNWVIHPWVGNVLDVSEGMAILLSGGIPFALLVAHMSGRIAEARARQRQQSRNPIDR